MVRFFSGRRMPRARGAGFVEKYGIRAARSFACTLKTIEAGPCPPILFDIPAVDRTDYFESAR